MLISYQQLVIFENTDLQHLIIKGNEIKIIDYINNYY